MKRIRYEVEGNRHGQRTMETTTLRRAVELCRLERRDGWLASVRRLADGAIVFPRAL